MSSVKNGSLTSFLPSWIPFISLCCLIAESRTSNTMLKKSGESEHLHIAIYVMLWWLNFDLIRFFNFFTFIYFFFEKQCETKREGGRGRGRRRHRIRSRLRLWARGQHSDLTMNCEIMTWAKFGRSTDWATQAPLDLILYSSPFHISDIWYLILHTFMLCF